LREEPSTAKHNRQRFHLADDDSCPDNPGHRYWNAFPTVAATTDVMLALLSTALLYEVFTRKTVPALDRSLELKSTL
jgi:hypothetical protein